ncbi:MAG: peptidylprolyl isomerase [Bacteroidia bacterium]
MSKKLILMHFLALVILCSCSKKNNNEQTPEPAKEKIVELSTSFGKIYIWLFKQTPLHRNNFLGLADTGFFNNTTFHRIVPNFVIQGGDPNTKDDNPNNDGQGGPGYTIPAEIDSSKFKHVYGAVGAARLSDAVNPSRASSGSQFYIVIPKAGTPNLNGAYTVFGQVISGMSVAETIVAQPRNVNDRPITNILMQVKVIEKTLEQLKGEFDFTPPNF